MISTTANFTAANAPLLGKQPILRLEIVGYARVFTTKQDGAPTASWIVSIEDLTQEINDLDGSSTIGDLVVKVQDYQRLVTADFPGFTFEGKVATLKLGYVGLAIADYATLFAGPIDTVASDDANLTYVFTAKDFNRVNQQVIYLVGDDGQPTGNDHPHTLLGNPLDLLLDILQVEIGYASSAIDIATITAFRDQLFAGMFMQFKITSPPEAKRFIEDELLKPLGGFGFVDALGRYTVGFFQPLAGSTTSVFSFSPSNLLNVPVATQAELVNVLSYRFDNDGQNFMAENVAIDEVSSDLYGQQGQKVIESQGVRSGFQGFSLSNMVCRSIFAQYSSKNPALTVQSNWQAALVSVADFVSVTHPLIPNRATGTLGITNKLFRVKRRRWQFNTLNCEFDLADASKIATFGSKKIAPDTLANWTAASSADRAKYLFMSDVNGLQSDGSPNGNLG